MSLLFLQLFDLSIKYLTQNIMIQILPISPSDCALLAEMAIETFLDTHSRAASKEIFDPYIAKTYNHEKLTEELLDPQIKYHFIFHNDLPVGYSKIILDTNHQNIDLNPVTKLERIYVLREHHDKKLGLPLLQHNIEVSKSNGDKGLWLFTWVENHRAIAFYQRNGFDIIGHHDFRLSESDTRPNHHMLLRY